MSSSTRGRKKKKLCLVQAILNLFGLLFKNQISTNEEKNIIHCGTFCKVRRLKESYFVTKHKTNI